MRTIAETIKDLRNEKNITQKMLAKSLSIPIPTLSHWECGYAEPSIKDIITLSNYFNVSTDYLLGRTDDFGSVILPASSPTAPALADDQKQLLDLYDRMTHQQKIRAIAYCEGLLSTSANVYSSRK
jgi:transcriptional regulator with XRE-family HTH domain